jgi:hypothetical protein
LVAGRERSIAGSRLIEIMKNLVRKHTARANSQRC